MLVLIHKAQPNAVPSYLGRIDETGQSEGRVYFQLMQFGMVQGGQVEPQTADPHFTVPLNTDSIITVYTGDMEKDVQNATRDCRNSIRYYLDALLNFAKNHPELDQIHLVMGAIPMTKGFGSSWVSVFKGYVTMLTYTLVLTKAPESTGPQGIPVDQLWTQPAPPIPLSPEGFSPAWWIGMAVAWNLDLLDMEPPPPAVRDYIVAADETDDTEDIRCGTLLSEMPWEVIQKHPDKVGLKKPVLVTVIRSTSWKDAQDQWDRWAKTQRQKSNGDGPSP